MTFLGKRMSIFRLVAMSCSVTLSIAALTSCAEGDAGKAKGVASGGATTGAAPTPTATPATTTPGEETYTISVEAPSVTSIYTSKTAEGGDPVCSSVRFNLKKADGTVGADVETTFTSAVIDPDIKLAEEVKAPPSEAEKTGGVSPLKAKSDASGNVTTKFCSGEQVTNVRVTATVGKSSANSAEIKVINKPTFSFAFKPKEGAKIDDALTLNLYDSGDDCTVLEFELKKLGASLGGEKVEFRTQEDFPAGLKLATKEQTGLERTNTETGRKYAYYEATSNAQGIFRVPMCAGVSTGTTLVTASYTDEFERKSLAKSPVITVKGGIASWGGLSLTYDAKNATIARSYFNQNGEEKHPFHVRLATRLNGNIVRTYPVDIMTEVGKIEVKENGVPDESGKMEFSIESLNIGARRPKQYMGYSSTSQYSPMCNPLDFPATGVAATEVKYADLSKNWRSKVVVYTKGQEFFYDANHNGRYDGGGDGFWDKNQNGIYDTGIDVLTYDAGNDGIFDGTKEWFIDLPTPFVDANDNGTHDADEPVAGDAYIAPNGKWDNLTYIWKNFLIPIYLGASPYSMLRSLISNDTASSTPSPEVLAYFLNKKGLFGFASNLKYYTSAISNAAGTTIPGLIGDSINLGISYNFSNPAAITQATLTDDQLASGNSTYRYFHAQGLCGTPMPGNSDITVNFKEVTIAAFGDRVFYSAFYVQPGDDLLDASRRLLIDAKGDSSAKINFDLGTRDDAAAVSYPIQFRIGVSACNSECTGEALSTTAAGSPGFACAAMSSDVYLTADGQTPSPGFVSVPAVRTTGCKCFGDAGTTDTVAGTHFRPVYSKGACSCTAGQSFEAGLGCKPSP
jgi:hypothetical protein